MFKATQKSQAKREGTGGGGTGSRGVLIPVLKAWKVLEIVKLKFQDFPGFKTFFSFGVIRVEVMLS